PWRRGARACGALYASRVVDRTLRSARPVAGRAVRILHGREGLRTWRRLSEMRSGRMVRITADARAGGACDGRAEPADGGPGARRRHPSRGPPWTNATRWSRRAAAAPGARRAWARR